MDAHRFDELTRSLAAGTTRRRLFKFLAGGVGASALALLGRGGALARPNCGLPGFPCCTTGPVACLAGVDCFRGICVGTRAGEAPVPPISVEAISCGLPFAPCCRTGQPCRPDLDCVYGICRIGLIDIEPPGPSGQSGD